MHLGVGINELFVLAPVAADDRHRLCIAIQSRLIRPEYFSHDFQLFPTWPRFDVTLMMALFWFSMLVLLIPKCSGSFARC